MPRFNPFFLCLCLALCLLGCSRSPFPKLSIPTGLPHDSLGYITLIGDSTSRQDTLHFADADELSLQPDTSLYHRAIVVYGRGERLDYYQLEGDVWHQATPPRPKSVEPKAFPQFYTTDIKNKHQSLDELIRSRVVAFTFVDYRDSLSNRKLLTKLDSTYKRDSIKHVLLYLNPSNQAVQKCMKRDSLSSERYIAISDSLGEVSRLRDSLGIARQPDTRTFVVDSTRRILRHK